MKRIRVALCQINCRVGGFSYNLSKIKRSAEKALNRGADVVCFPELAVCGYQPEDLLLKPGFVQKNIDGVNRIKTLALPLTVIIGFVDRSGGEKTGRIHNAAAVISGGRLCGIYRKNLLPNYGVFDEKRYFEPGNSSPVFEGGNFRIGVNICEDIWFEDGPAALQAEKGADLIFNLSASPYSIGKPAEREKMLSKRAKALGAPLAFCNLVGGQDEIVFDGHSAFFDEKGAVAARAKGFAEDTIFRDFDFSARARKRNRAIRAEYKIKAARTKEKPPLRIISAGFASQEEQIFSALTVATRDYVEKNGFKTVVLGLSGGIDSALVAAVAAEALGPGRVVAVNMPSVFSSKTGIKDSISVAKNLGLQIHSVPISKIFSAYTKSVPAAFGLKSGEKSSSALENIQARIRGNILMAFSNRFGWLVLTTGNKSEISVGYSTLYGDSAGGFSVIKDVKKTVVYELARYYNSLRGFDAIPKSIIDKPPSAELKKGQRDCDDLPPYEILDEILFHYVESDKTVAETVLLSGASGKTVKEIVNLVDKNEYKRRQSPPGIKLTGKAFGKDRRMPITNFYRD